MSDTPDPSRWSAPDPVGATDATRPFDTPPTEPRGASALPPPPTRPWSYPSSPVPITTRFESDTGVSWPTAPPSEHPPAASLHDYGPPQAPPPVPPASVPPSDGRRGSPSGGRGAFVALLAVVALLAGLLGAVIGVNAADDDDTSSGPLNTSIDRPAGGGQPSIAPPITGEVDEPVAAVAQAVGPSVVLISTDAGEGSGIIYDSNGSILTNAHVVSGFDRVDVTLADGEIYQDAEVLGADENRDIAVVKIEPRQDLTAAVFGETSAVHVGQTAVAIGSPFGLEQTVTSGIVSAVGRVVSATNPVEMIQTDAPINPGNSGGPLADVQGRVIGMNTSIRTAGGADSPSGSVGVGFAIPSDTLLDIAQRISTGDTLDVAYLGVRGSAPTGSTAGVVLIEVRPNSPAEAAGLRVGDQVTAIDGDPVTNMSSLSARIQLHRPNDQIELTIERDDQPLTATVTLGSAG